MVVVAVSVSIRQGERGKRETRGDESEDRLEEGRIDHFEERGNQGRYREEKGRHQFQETPPQDSS